MVSFRSNVWFQFRAQVSSDGRAVQPKGTASDVIISRRGGSKRMRFALEVARVILEWGKSIGEKSK